MAWFTAISNIVLGLPLMLILVGVIFVAYWLNAFFLMYHLMRFGIGPRPKLLALIFLVGSLMLFTGAVYSFNSIRLDDILRSLQEYTQRIPILNY